MMRTIARVALATALVLAAMHSSAQDQPASSAGTQEPTQEPATQAPARVPSSQTPTTAVEGRRPVQAVRPASRPYGVGNFSNGANTASPNAQFPGGGTAEPQPHISVVSPPVVVAQAPVWSRHERILWGAEVVLAILGYVGIVVAVGTLRSIRRQMNSMETMAKAMAESASAVTAIGSTLTGAQRPWILMQIERSKDVAESFNILAKNCGRTPAEIIDCPDRVSVAANENQLPKNRANAIKGFGVLNVPIMLLPGDSAVIQRFGRDDLKWVCKSEDSRQRIERKEDSVFIYGSVIYREPAISDREQTHRTDWCCRYVHEETSSNLLLDGPPDYNKHL